MEKQSGNNFDWLGNIATGSTVTLECNLVELEALCPLAHAVDPDKPADVTFGDAEELGDCGEVDEMAAIGLVEGGHGGAPVDGRGHREH